VVRTESKQSTDYSSNHEKNISNSFVLNVYYLLINIFCYIKTHTQTTRKATNLKTNAHAAVISCIRNNFLLILAKLLQSSSL